MLHKFTTLLLLLPLSVFAEFSSSSDSRWNYHYEQYSNVGGVLEENKATPLFTIEQSILDTILNSLPENRRADQDHPEYFPSPEPEIIVKETADIFVTFYHEGAGYRNSLGYYTYGGDTSRSRPQSLQDIKDNGVILFPNTSLLYSGGDLSRGTTVSLGELSAGTKVLFFLVSNGWKGNTTGVRSSSDWIFTSLSSLNLEYDPNSTKEVPDDKHVALLWNDVGPGNILLMGFEDILRTYRSCDHDYNDVLFSVSSSPMSALGDTIEVETGEKGFSVVAEELDTDGDGVDDALDDYPEDINRTFTSYYPNKTSNATLIFEDMWPDEGDYDMNDLSIAFSIQEIKNADHEVKDIIFTGEIQSYGASFTNGLSIQVNTPASNIASAIKTENNIDHNIMSNIKEDGDYTIIKLFDDAIEYLPHYANVDKNSSYIKSETFEIKVTLKTAAKIISPPYNPFLTVKSYRNDIEVHLPNYLPTSYLGEGLLGTFDDTSNIASGRTYLTADNKPWGLLIPTKFAHPAEHINIKDAYIHYQDWVNSAGSTKSDWYIYNKKNNQDNFYADQSKIIIHP